MSARDGGSGSQDSTSILTRMAFAAPAERVWNGLMFYEQIDERPPLHLRLLLPVPIGTEKADTIVGAVVRCSYEGGHLLKRITDLNPKRHYGFDVVEQTLSIGGGLTLSGGGYALRELPDGHTEVAVTTRYTGGRRPAWFWKPVEAAVCHLFHRHLLAAMRRKVEELNRPDTMPHNIGLITTIAVALGLAMVMGYVASRLKMPPLVGYLVAGIVIGPATPGFVADVDLASQLAGIGVMLLMFGVGLHFSLGDLMSVRRLAVPGAIAQMTAATALGVAIAMFWGWAFGTALVFGLALSVASTVVLLRTLDDRGVLDSGNGRIATGWLVVQDLVMVVVLVLLPPIAALLGGKSDAAVPGGGGEVWTTLGITLAKVAAFIALMLVAGRRLFPRLLWLVAQTGSRELFTLCVVAVAVGVAYGAAELFGVSFALGAFFAGMMMRGSEFSHRAAEESLPLRDAFSVLFFVSVGMLFEPQVLVDEPLKVLATIAIIMVGSPLAAIALVLVFGYPLATALIVGASLAQIGEFSFILAGLGVALGLFPTQGQSLILAGALISIALNSLVFAAIGPGQRWLRERSALARALERSADPLAELPATVDQSRLTGQIVLVGYGRVGRRIAEALDEQGISYVVAEQNRELVEMLRGRNIAAVSGDASDPAVLIQAHIARAGMLVIAIPDTFDVRKMVEIARALNPRIETVLRTHNDDEAELLERDKLGKVFVGEHQLALGMTRYILERIGVQTPG